MRQSSLTGFEKYTKKIRKEQFLEEMDRIIPWSDLTQALVNLVMAKRRLLQT